VIAAGRTSEASGPLLLGRIRSRSGICAGGARDGEAHRRFSDECKTSLARASRTVGWTGYWAFLNAWISTPREMTLDFDETRTCRVFFEARRSRATKFCVRRGLIHERDLPPRGNRREDPVLAKNWEFGRHCEDRPRDPAPGDLRDALAMTSAVLQSTRPNDSPKSFSFNADASDFISHHPRAVDDLGRDALQQQGMRDVGSQNGRNVGIRK